MKNRRGPCRIVPTFSKDCAARPVSPSLPSLCVSVPLWLDFFLPLFVDSGRPCVLIGGGRRTRHGDGRRRTDGVTAVLAPDVSSTDEMLAHMDRVMVEGGYLQQGQLVVFLAGQPVGQPGTTNLMKLHRVGVA